MPTTYPETETIRSSEHGLIGWLENTRIALPLKGVEARFEVVGEVAHVELDQIYHQTAARPLDCLYSFPLPTEAAIHRCEFHVNDRVISARVEELQKARALYDEARRSGHRAALIESERANLFTLNLANVQPDDLIVVRLAYVQTLERVGRERRLRIPFCPGIRYCPGRPLMGANQGRGTSDDTTQVPDASRISPPRIDALHPDSAYVAVSGTLRIARGDFTGVTTKSHAIQTSIESDQVQISLSDGGAVPDQDFLLGWELPKTADLRSRAWTSVRDGWTYALVELCAPAALGHVAREPLDVYFLLDRSGSMAGVKWHKSCQALDRLLGCLNESDRVQVTLFQSAFDDLLPSPKSVDKFCRQWPTAKIEAIGTAGGTELLPALHHVLKQVKRFSEGRKPVLVLITDGQVGNERAIVEALRLHSRLVLHAFGIDTVVNDAILTDLARQQRGSYVMLRPDENIPAAIGRMGALLTAPVVTDLLVPDGWETADGPLPDLYAGQVGSAVVRGRGALPEVCEGRNAQGQAIKLPLTARVSMSPAVPLLWAQKRIRGLESRRDLVAAVPLAKEFNLICQGTAFVAWDEVEHVAVANQRVYQPSLDPASWECFARHPRLMRAICLNDVEVRDVFHMHHQESEDLFQSETPLPRPVWARHSLFSSPGGDQIVELLTDWLKSLAAIRRLWAERRLKKLINAVEREFQQDPAAQLQALTQRLGSLIGKLGPFAERLQGILQVASW